MVKKEKVSGSEEEESYLKGKRAEMSLNEVRGGDLNATCAASTV